MSETCDHNCENCASKCENPDPQSFLEPQNEMSDIKNVIAVVSGKGGVGKSLVTALLAVHARRSGFSTAIIDADITGPSMPKSFGVKQRAEGSDLGLFPVETATGIKLMSLNLLLENDTDPVVWRGPVIAGAVKQFWTDVVWNDVDYMFVDLPPGTGDVPLTVFQSLPVKGIVIVTSPQDLVGMIVGKAAKMAQMMNIPILGIVENFSYYTCPDCGKQHFIFGESKLEEIAALYGVKNTARLPIDPKLSAACDKGMIELNDAKEIVPFADKLLGTEKTA
ncbi:MAG: Mrp/NBP35 family ATP-binding protein [Clostridia bacterium]|nr:Mrp/NBP35 family ATP-binding protein [Clostridia bacterium]MBR0537245.1 Mrp/NBP35 family ATP-binding protein [Clostridia bacterium]